MPSPVSGKVNDLFIIFHPSNNPPVRSMKGLTVVFVAQLRLRGKCPRLPTRP